MTDPDTPQARWTVESAGRHPVLRWSGDLFLDVGGLYPEAYKALVRAVEDAAQLPDTEAQRDQWKERWERAQNDIDLAQAERDLQRKERDALAAIVARYRSGNATWEPGR